MYVLNREQKTESDGADVICCGRLFQIRTTATGNAQLLGQVNCGFSGDFWNTNNWLHFGDDLNPNSGIYINFFQQCEAACMYTVQF